MSAWQWEMWSEIDPGNLSVWWEIESSGTDYMSGSVVVKGRLKNHISFWREVIKAPATIISTIDGGYVLPLKSEPTPYVRGNHQSACKNSLFIQESLSELCTAGCAVEVSARPIICSPLSVVDNSSGKKRLRLRVSVVPTHLIAVRLLLDIAKNILRQILKWNSPLKICALYIRIIRTMGQGQSERNIEIAFTACLWR